MEEKKVLGGTNMIEMPIFHIPDNNNNSQENYSDSSSDSDSDSDSRSDDGNNSDGDIKDKENMLLKSEENSASDKSQRIRLYDDNGVLLFNPNLPIGNNIILKNGNLILGIKEEIPQILIVITVGIALLIAWLVFIFPYYVYGPNLKSICLVIIILYGLAQYYHIMCFLTEPGIIPRNHPVYQIPFGKNSYARIPGHPNLIEQRDCHICGLEKPFRTSHCVRCDNCIEEYDHHCGFIANCVGKRNRKYFFLFILFTCLYTWLMFLTSFIQIIGLGYYASDLFINLFSNVYVSAIITIGVFSSLITYPLLNQVFYLKVGLSISMFFYIVMFYVHREANTPFFINPFGVAMTLFCLQCAIFPSCMLTSQIKVIALDFTSNQINNLIQYRRTINEDRPEDGNNQQSAIVIEEVPRIKEIPQLTIKEKLKNFKYFCLRRRPPSLLAHIYKA